MVKNPPANARDESSIPESGRVPGKGNGNPLRYSCLGNPIDRGAWQAKSMESQKVRHDLANKQSQKQKLPSLSKHTHFMQNHNKKSHLFPKLKLDFHE